MLSGGRPFGIAAPGTTTWAGSSEGSVAAASFSQRRLRRSSPGSTRSSALALDGTWRRFRYASPGERSRFPCLPALPWHACWVQPCFSKIAVWIPANVLENDAASPQEGVTRIPSFTVRRGFRVRKTPFSIVHAPSTLAVRTAFGAPSQARQWARNFQPCRVRFGRITTLPHAVDTFTPVASIEITRRSDAGTLPTPDWATANCAVQAGAGAFFAATGVAARAVTRERTSEVLACMPSHSALRASGARAFGACRHRSSEVPQPSPSVGANAQEQDRRPEGQSHEHENRQEIVADVDERRLS